MNSPYSTRIFPFLLSAAFGVGGLPARAELPDEIQVYTDDLDAPGKFGLELHVNTTPSGRSTPDYPGEVPPRHALRITPEFSYGVTGTIEAGLYLPTVRDAEGGYGFAGPKLRLKWIPLRPGEGESGWFAGLNTELARLDRKYSESRWSYELRTIVGWRNDRWLLAANPIFSGGLSSDASRKVEGTFSIKATRRVAADVAVGLEYYADYGPLSDRLSRDRQAHTVFAVADFEHGGIGVNVGVGYGLTAGADRWTLKTIFEIPF